jgi:ferredoxin-fold anticodon binding domain-containing protein
MQNNRNSTSKYVDNILKIESKGRAKTRFMDPSLSEELDSNVNDNLSDDQQFSNPIVDDVNTDRNSLIDSDQQVLDELIKEVNIFDIFSGKNIAEDKKSVALRVRIQPIEKTLTSEEIDMISKKIIDAVGKFYGATLR